MALYHREVAQPRNAQPPVDMVKLPPLSRSAVDHMIKLLKKDGYQSDNIGWSTIQSRLLLQQLEEL